MSDQGRTERKSLPGRAEIRAMTDIVALDQLCAEVQRTAERISVDLEMQIGDDDWDRRARAALAAHRICVTQIKDRLNDLSRGAGVETALAQQARQQEKLRLQAERAARETERLKAQSAAHLDKAERARQTAKIERIRLFRETSLGIQFMHAARARLEPDVYAAILDAANARVLAGLDRVLPEEPLSAEALQQ